MNRRKVLLGSGVALSAALAGCSSDDTSDDGNGNGDDTESSDENADADLSGVYNYRKFDRFTTPGSSDGVFWESDDETQYVGAQVRLTNETDDELSLGGSELGILAGDNGGNITFHSRSNTDPLESISAGETVETWLVFTVTPGTEIEGFGPTQWAEHSFDLEEDSDLEIFAVDEDDTSSESTAELPEQPEITTTDYNPNSSGTSLSFQWNATVFDAMAEKHGNASYTSDAGEQYLLLALRIENTGDMETSFSPGGLDIVSDGEEAGWSLMPGGLRSTEIPAGEVLEGWTPMTIVEGAPSVSITVSPAFESYAATFEQDESLEIPFEPIDPSS